MRDLGRLLSVVFSGLSPLVVEDETDEGERIRVRARTPDGPVACPGCGAWTVRVHGYHERSVADVAVDARCVLVVVRIRRLICPTRGCRQTFREQLPGVPAVPAAWAWRTHNRSVSRLMPRSRATDVIVRAGSDRYNATASALNSGG